MSGAELSPEAPRGPDLDRVCPHVHTLHREQEGERCKRICVCPHKDRSGSADPDELWSERKIQVQRTCRFCFVMKENQILPGRTRCRRSRGQTPSSSG